MCETQFQYQHYLFQQDFPIYILQGLACSYSRKFLFNRLTFSEHGSFLHRSPFHGPPFILEEIPDHFQVAKHIHRVDNITRILAVSMLHFLSLPYDNTDFTKKYDTHKGYTAVSAKPQESQCYTIFQLLLALPDVGK